MLSVFPVLDLSNLNLINSQQKTNNTNKQNKTKDKNKTRKKRKNVLI